MISGDRCGPTSTHWAPAVRQHCLGHWETAPTSKAAQKTLAVYNEQVEARLPAGLGHEVGGDEWADWGTGGWGRLGKRVGQSGRSWCAGEGGGVGL